MNGAVLAIDAGGTKVHLAVAHDGQIVSDVKIETRPEQGGAQCLKRMMEHAERLIQETGQPIQSIGLASPGVVHPVTKTTAHTWNIPDWDQLNVADNLRSAFSVPIAIENDANMAAIAESVHGNHGPSFAFFAVGTGFGAGLILGRRLWTGKSGGAGEIARWVMNLEGLKLKVNYGHLEYLMSGSGFETRYLELTGQSLSGGQIAALAHQGDPIATQIFDEAASYLSIAAANVSSLLDLDAVVLGGGVITKDPEYWLRRVNEVTQSLCLYPPNVVLSRLGDKAVLLGAIAEAYRIVEEDN